MKQQVTPRETDISIAEDRGLVLIVDDDPLSLKALEHFLEKDGYEVFKAKDGKEALSLIDKHPFALILCDQKLPDIEGIEILRQAVSSCPDAGRILLTGHSDVETAIDAINISQVSQYLVKPWKPEQLRKAVQNALDKYKLLKENQFLQELILTQHHQLAKTHENLQNELHLGGRIHEELLMGKVPKKIDGFSIEATSIPSKEIDGDFYEFYQPAEHILDIVIGDVMGKGIPAALVGTALKTQLIRFAIPFSRGKIFDKKRVWEEDLLTPTEIVSHLSHAIAGNLIHLEHFATLFYGRFNKRSHTFTYVDCGSTKPMHYQASTKKIVELKGDNFPMGVIEYEHYSSQKTSFAPGDVFVFYSDAVTEARSPTKELFGIERLEQIIQEFHSSSSHDLVGIIKQAVINYAQKEVVDDDLTLVVVKIEKTKNPNIARVMTAKFTSNLSQLEAVRDFVNRLCQNGRGDIENTSNLLQLAINEIFCNIVKHSYNNDPTGKVVIRGELLEDGIVIEVADQGVAHNPAEVDEPNLTGDQGDGFGWHIIKSVADRVSYVGKKTESGWNHLQIFKRYELGGEAMNFGHTKKENVLIIKPELDTLDAKGSPEFKQKVMEIISTDGSRAVIFDLQQLNFIDSSGLGTFLSILRNLSSQGGDLRLSNMNKPIRTMFELVKMHKVFDIYNTSDEAIHSFK